MQPNQLLTIDQVNALAKKAGYDPINLRTILDVESSGHGFSTVTGRLIIQFEPSWFKKTDKEWREHTASGVWLNNGIGNQTQEWDAFNDAFKSNPTAAMLSTSIGLPQVMGFHYSSLGFKAVGDMWDFAKVSEANQVDLMIRFIKLNPKLDKAVKFSNWDDVAYYYNGAGYKELAARTGSLPYNLRLERSKEHLLQAA
jgi:hypothetical protein